MKIVLSGLLLLAHVCFSQNQTAPRPQGNFFVLPPQMVKNVMRFSQFPKDWTKPANRVFIHGYGVPYTASMAENQERLTNAGFTHFEREDLITRLNIPVSKRFRMLRDADAQNVAKQWARTLPASDPRKAPLAAYGANFSVAVNNPALWKELGKRTYNALRGNGLGLVAFDIETFAEGTPGNLAEQFSTNASLGVAQAITENGDATTFFQYGGSLAAVINLTQNRQDNDPYMRVPGGDWRGSNGVFSIDAHPLTTFYRTQGAFVGRDQYARRTWDDRSVWQKNGDGSLAVDGAGNPVFVRSAYPTATVTNYGVQSFVYTTQAQYWIEMWYEEADKILTDWRWLCNTPVTGYDGNFVPGTMPYPRGSVDIRPGMEKIRLCSWYRDETEFESSYDPATGKAEQIESANNRPLNPRSTRYQLLMRSLLYHGNILWSDKAMYTNFVPGRPYVAEMGGRMVPQRDLAMGQWEAMVAGHYQASSYPKYFTLMDQNKLEFIIPKRFILKGNTAVGERFVDKPIVWLMKEQAGRALYGAWVYPVQDVNNPSHERDITVWIVLDNGQISGSWKLHCANRDTGYDAWIIPPGFEKAKPENFCFQFTNLLGQTFTWTGNYNVPFRGAKPIPPKPIARAVIGTGIEE